MDWLSTEIDRLDEMVRREAVQMGDPAEHQALSDGIREAIAALVRHIAEHDGVEAVVAIHGDHVVESAGSKGELAPALNELRGQLDRSAEALGLGSALQGVLVGAEGKLALVALGDRTLAIRVARGRSLAQALADR